MTNASVIAQLLAIAHQVGNLALFSPPLQYCTVLKTHIFLFSVTTAVLERTEHDSCINCNVIARIVPASGKTASTANRHHHHSAWRWLFLWRRLLFLLRLLELHTFS